MSETVRKFYELSADERLSILHSEGIINSSDASRLSEVNAQGIINPDIASHIIENQISQYALPMGVVRGLIVNGKKYTVPLVVEEASVVAAATNGARMVARSGGVSASTQPHRVLGEIVFESSDISGNRAQEIIVSRETELFDIARKALPSMHARGGGLESIYACNTDDGRFTKIILVVNPCDAMGANAVNTIAESLKAVLSQWFDAHAIVAILSNSGNISLTTAVVELDPMDIAFRGHNENQAMNLAERIVALSDLAYSDYDRSVTHNKGIMNGISSAVLATGNDTRAVESAAHAYAAHSGRYRALSSWSINENGHLCGMIELPLQVGIVGGSSSSLEIAGIARRMGNYANVDEFKMVLASLGLVQNLSALRALAGPGIQAGHMNLQMNSLAIAAGAQGEEITRIAERLRLLSPDKRTLATAQEFVKETRDKQFHKTAS
ncbi:hydroxymethylglutaryl-CoA reductase, degradative [Alloscardovia theropitheci]|uniref:3-hydroxy-3-methylglutaryl coenzyme A reductase n=1 Tax=Alloscardovia theropitheci TaxID=2496842 RepID=A0A4V2MU11_9BIFI|nr:hydroxymethylglutaryl-CoA reductase, degradative [Alloscardovia theropitheci]TCD54579.1 hydroxymethylglutaryl-CoA reductase, degradative [Alloscardovia theropitheci]